MTAFGLVVLFAGTRAMGFGYPMAVLVGYIGGRGRVTSWCFSEDWEEVMTGELFLAMLKDWLIPIGSVVLSIWFASSAKKDADRADRLLAQIKESVEGSQRRMIDSATGLLDSLPQVIAGKNSLATMKAVETILDTIRENISNPRQLPATEHERQIIALSAQLDMLLKRSGSSSGST